MREETNSMNLFCKTVEDTKFNVDKIVATLSSNNVRRLAIYTNQSNNVDIFELSVYRGNLFVFYVEDSGDHFDSVMNPDGKPGELARFRLKNKFLSQFIWKINYGYQLVLEDSEYPVDYYSTEESGKFILTFGDTRIKITQISEPSPNRNAEISLEFMRYDKFIDSV